MKIDAHLTIAHLKLFWSTLYELFKTISADANLVGWYCDEHLLWFWNVYKEGLFLTFVLSSSLVELIAMQC